MFGVHSIYHTDAATGDLIVQRWQDVAPILDRNKALANDGDGYSPSRELCRVATIPPLVVEMWMNEGVDVLDPDHAPEVARRLNSSDWLWLRNAPGRV